MSDRSVLPLLPSQVVSRKEGWTPEQELIWAMVKLAWADSRRPGWDTEGIRYSAIRWLASESELLFTCRWCCEQVGVDPARLRQLAARGCPWQS